MLLIKFVWNLISYKEVNGRICLFPPGMELGGSLQFQYIVIFQKW